MGGAKGPINTDVALEPNALDAAERLKAEYDLDPVDLRVILRPLYRAMKKHGISRFELDRTETGLRTVIS
jgi:hypothetical protein